jgi:hypothetical protein
MSSTEKDGEVRTPVTGSLSADTDLLLHYLFDHLLQTLLPASA